MSTVLVVDDDPNSLAISSLVLGSAGYDVVEAVDGKTALAAAEVMLPDLVFLDILLPEMDGFHVLELLRQLPGAAELPVVALSLFGSPVNDQRERNEGRWFNAWLTKPITPTQLVDAVRAVLDPDAGNTRLPAETP